MIRKRLTKGEIEKSANQALQDHDYNSIIPVPVDLMVERLPADVVPKKGMLDRIGIDAFWSNDFSELYIDEERYMSNHNHRGRFTLAHELGHYYLHRTEGTQFSSLESWKKHVQGNTSLRKVEEWEANQFAGFLLVPSVELQKKFRHLKEHDKSYKCFIGEDEPDEAIASFFLDELSKHFEVSTVRMEIRLKNFKDY